MENIIKKAIEGGWVNVKGATEEQIKVVLEVELKNPYRIVCDHLFWQALGKACRWNWLDKRNWKYFAIHFHEINLTQGWDKAVEYLEDLIKN